MMHNPTRGNDRLVDLITDPDPSLSTIACSPLRKLVRVQGTIRAIRMQPQVGVATLRARIDDGTAELDVLFLGRRRITGIDVGRALIVEGVIGEGRNGNQMLNPVYRLL